MLTLDDMDRVLSEEIKPIDLKALGERFGVNINRRDAGARKFWQAVWRSCEAMRAQGLPQFRVDGDKLVALTPLEQSKYAATGRRTAQRKLVRSLDRATRVPVAALPENYREAHARLVDRLERDVALGKVSQARMRRILDQERKLVEAMQEDSARRARAAKDKGKAG